MEEGIAFITASLPLRLCNTSPLQYVIHPSCNCRRAATVLASVARLSRCCFVKSMSIGIMRSRSSFLLLKTRCFAVSSTHSTISGRGLVPVLWLIRWKDLTASIMRRDITCSRCCSPSPSSMSFKMIFGAFVLLFHFSMC